MVVSRYRGPDLIVGVLTTPYQRCLQSSISAGLQKVEKGCVLRNEHRIWTGDLPDTTPPKSIVVEVSKPSL